MREDFSFKSENLDLYCYAWQDTEKPKAAVQIIHGSLEHALRYEDFARFLASKGYVVYASDLRGHGKSAGRRLNYFSDSPGGWNNTLTDISILHARIREYHPQLPIFMLGHSMGSILLRCYVVRYAPPKGILLSGTGGGRSLLLHTARLLARVFMLRGRDTPNTRLHKLVYGSINVPHAQTPYDFISRDTEVVQHYIDDPLCGNTTTPEYIYELTGGILEANSPDTFLRTPRDLPVLLFSGEKDPVGGVKEDGEEVRRVFDRYQRAGLHDIMLKLYPDARHEMLNEINKSEVYADILQWLDQRVVRMPGQ